MIPELLEKIAERKWVAQTCKGLAFLLVGAGMGIWIASFTFGPEYVDEAEEARVVHMTAAALELTSPRAVIQQVIDESIERARWKTRRRWQNVGWLLWLSAAGFAWAWLVLRHYDRSRYIEKQGDSER